MSRPDVIVVGGGIVGAACALELARDGNVVEVVESRGIGGGATAAGMGHVILLDDSPAQFALTRWSRDLWTALGPELPAGVQVDACGCIWIASSDAEMDLVADKVESYRRAGIAAERLDAVQLAEAEPNLRPGLAGGLLIPGDMVVYPPVAARWMIEQSADLGASVAMGNAVSRIDGRRVFFADGTTREADWVVNAAGHHALGLLGEAGAGLTIHPRKGHLVITNRVPGFCHHQLVGLGYLASAHTHSASSVAFNLQPRATGQLLLGSSRQYGVESDAVEPAIVARMIACAIEYVPGLASLDVVRTWTGFRAATPDKLPLIGTMPGVPGLVLASGHEGLGITTSLATGRMVADVIAGRSSEIDRTPYAIERCLEA